MKTCSKCKQSKPADLFGRTPNGNLRNSCKSCMSSAQLERTARQKEDDPDEWVRIRRYRVIKYKYGLTREQFECMLEKQDGVCAICKRVNRTKQPHTNTPLDPAWLSVDHCHTTGKVRGLLCTPCNSALGLLEDNLEFMKNATNYLETRGT